MSQATHATTFRRVRAECIADLWSDGFTVTEIAELVDLSLRAAQQEIYEIRKNGWASIPYRRQREAAQA
jgi:hypothetical protein